VKRARRAALVAILITLIVVVASLAFGSAAYCVIASTGIGGLAPRLGAAKCETFLAGASALLAPIVAAIAAYIAYQQHRTTREAFRHSLYERRAEILRGTLAALGGVFRDGKVPGETLTELLRATSEKNYLLDSDLSAYLEELYRKAVRGYTLYLEFKDVPAGPERTRLVNEHAAVVGWLTEQPAVLRQRFIPYLRFSEDDI
jgi:hypothetical protein